MMSILDPGAATAGALCCYPNVLHLWVIFFMAMHGEECYVMVTVVAGVLGFLSLSDSLSVELSLS